GGDRHPALRRYACRLDGRDRADPYRQDREEGPREPPVPHPFRPAAFEPGDAAMSQTSLFVVSADWLQERLGKPGLSIVDGSWYLPTQGRDARAEYQAAHIPGAVFFDHDKVVEPGSDLPHTLPSPRLFAQFASSM